MRRLSLALWCWLALVGAKCVDYDPNLTPPAPVESSSVCDPADATPTLDGMRKAACVGTRCTSGEVATYWRDYWEQVAVQRTLTFIERSSGTWGLELRDASGALAPWSFEVGVPVSLTIENPIEATAPHDLTAPSFFRSVAWDAVRTTDSEHRASAFDAFILGTDAANPRHVLLRFVPIVAGTYTLYSSQGVTGGDRYEQILAGTVMPDLATGDAGHGMKSTVEVVGTPLSLFVEHDIERPQALATDPRRYAGDPVWSSPEQVTITSSESFSDETGEPVYIYTWSTKTLTRGLGYDLLLHNPPTNRSTTYHNFSAPGLLRDSVFRAAADAHVEVRAPGWLGNDVYPGGTVHLYVVPTALAHYTAYCRSGVVFGHSGFPDFTTGHPASGMIDELDVVGP